MKCEFERPILRSTHSQQTRVGGPYRLDSGNPIHQVSDEQKQNVPEHVRKAAREMAQKAFRERLREIQMSEYDHDIYKKYADNIKKPAAI